MIDLSRVWQKARLRKRAWKNLLIRILVASFASGKTRAASEELIFKEIRRARIIVECVCAAEQLSFVKGNVSGRYERRVEDASWLARVFYFIRFFSSCVSSLELNWRWSVSWGVYAIVSNCWIEVLIAQTEYNYKIVSLWMEYEIEYGCQFTLDRSCMEYELFMNLEWYIRYSIDVQWIHYW